MEILKLMECYQKTCESSELFKRLEKFSSTEIADAAGKSAVMSSRIQLNGRRKKLIGQAYTVKVPLLESQMTLDAISRASQGDVLVIDTSHNYMAAVWGDIKTIRAITSGIAGVVIDGLVRDVRQIRTLPLPVFSAGNIPCASGHAGGGVCGQEIMCGDIMVRTGDVVFGDDDGVVVIQREALASVIEKAEAKKKLDEERIEEILKRIF